MFDISVFVFAPIVGLIQNRFDKKNLILFGYLVGVITSTAFGMLEYETDE